jgi:hypothetical protein
MQAIASRISIAPVRASTSPSGADERGFLSLQAVGIASPSQLCGDKLPIDRAKKIAGKFREYATTWRLLILYAVCELRGVRISLGANEARVLAWPLEQTAAAGRPSVDPITKLF